MATEHAVNYSVDILRQDVIRRSHVLDVLLDLKARLQVSNKRVLEIGCGLAQNLKAFRSDNHIRGIDGLPDAVAALNAEGIEAECCDVNRPLAVPDNDSDLILCLDVLEHLNAPEVAMVEMARILRPGGHLVINVPNQLNLSGRFKILLGSGMDNHRYFPGSEDWNNPHIRFFTFSGIRKLATSSGLELWADWSHLFPSCPLIGNFEPLIGRSLFIFLAQKWPNLFTAGYFLILSKPTRKRL